MQNRKHENFIHKILKVNLLSLNIKFLRKRKVTIENITFRLSGVQFLIVKATFGEGKRENSNFNLDVQMRDFKL